MQNTYLWNIIIVVSRVVLSAIILGPHVDQLVIRHALTSGFNFDDAIMSP